MSVQRCQLGLLIASLGVTLGCGLGEPPRFVANNRAQLTAELVDAHSGQIDTLLTEWFGTPDEPRLPPADGITSLMTLEDLELAAGPVESHEVGVTHGLYRRHCARCHGVSGDGRGPAARYQAPYPRDFRAGIFKFKSAKRGQPPTGDDLHATLLHGLPGTAMPSFALLTQRERQALVEYVRYLAIRGQTESELIALVADELDYDPITNETNDPIASGEALRLLNEVTQQWQAIDSTSEIAETSTTSEDAIAAGKVLFHNPKRANCIACHGTEGQGGITLEERDYWSQQQFEFTRATDLMAGSLDTLKQQIKDTPADRRTVLAQQQTWLTQQLEKRRHVAANDFPLRTSQPRRLAGGVARGLRKPEDLHRSLRDGIEGSAMPGVGEILSQEELSYLVSYVESIMARPYVGGASNE